MILAAVIGLAVMSGAAWSEEKFGDSKDRLAGFHLWMNKLPPSARMSYMSGVVDALTLGVGMSTMFKPETLRVILDCAITHDVASDEVAEGVTKQYETMPDRRTIAPVLLAVAYMAELCNINIKDYAVGYPN